MKPLLMFLRALSGWLLCAGAALAQDIEPRAYSHAPEGVNFAVIGYARTEGGLAFDPALPVKNPNLETNSAVLAYARSLTLWGMSAKLGGVLPYTWLDGSAQLGNDTITRTVEGTGDLRLRLSVNLLGAPPMTLQEFARYRQDLIVGVSLKLSAPTGQYDSSRLVNIGSNRWAVEPELGASKALGPWTLEGAVAMIFYTDNDDFYGGQTRSQDDIITTHGHIIRNFAGGHWLSLDANYFTGGRTTLDGERGNDLQQNWRTGITAAFSLDRLHSIKFNASSGVSARTGNNFDLIGIAWQYRWGGGL